MEDEVRRSSLVPHVSTIIKTSLVTRRVSEALLPPHSAVSQQPPTECQEHSAHTQNAKQEAEVIALRNALIVSDGSREAGTD